MKTATRSYIVVTRPEPGLTETILEIQKMGWKTVRLPLLMIEPLSNCHPDTRSIQALIFTSRQAIPLAVKLFKSRELAYQHIPVFTVGDKSAEDARKLGFLRVQSAHGDAVSLNHLLQKKLDPLDGDLLFLSGKQQGQQLTDHLIKAGFQVIHQAVYEACPVRCLEQKFIDVLQGRQIDSILFYSANTARIFIEMMQRENRLDILREVKAIGISSKVQSVLKRIQWNEIRTAEAPDARSMLSLLG